MENKMLPSFITFCMVLQTAYFIKMKFVLSTL